MVKFNVSCLYWPAAIEALLQNTCRHQLTVGRQAVVMISALDEGDTADCATPAATGNILPGRVQTGIQSGAGGYRRALFMRLEVHFGRPEPTPAAN